MRLKRRAEQSTLWLEVRPVSPPAWQDDGREVLTCDGSGLSFSACAARLLPAGSWQRTLSASLASSLTGSTGCAVSLRLRATKCGRSLLVPTMLERPTEGSESGSSRDNWSTPDTQMERDGTYRRKDRDTGSRHGESLHHQMARISLWPTVHEGNPRRNGPTGNELGRAVTRAEWPTASAVPYGNNRGGGAGRVGPVRPSLEGAARLWPTATSGDGKSSGTRTGTPHASSTASHPGTTLTDAANGLWAGRLAPDSPSTGGKRPAWPTVRAGTDAMCGGSGHKAMLKGTQLEKGRGSLNPAWVSQLMGFPTGWLAASPPVTAAKPSKASATRSSQPVPSSSERRSERLKRDATE
jgi:hypothetical protein